MINGALEAKQDHQYSAFEQELNTLVRKHFPHWGARDLLK
jgi:sulfate adenylyltransferase subunit 1